jgi:hypothetical protein
VPASVHAAPREGAAVVRMIREVREIEPDWPAFKCVRHLF